MSYQIEFPDFPVAEMPVIPAGFEDISWHNDACPSFLNEPAGLIVFVDYTDPAKREFSDTPRFNVNSWDNGNTGVTVAESDDWETIVDAIGRHILGAEYKAAVGYNPFEDDATATLDSVRKMLVEFKIAAALENGIDTADIDQKIALAREFGSLIQEELSSAQFRETVYRNKASTESYVCHSHDFCDANMVMLDAFKRTFSRTPVFLNGSETAESLADLALWGDAWQIAKAADFFA